MTKYRAYSCLKLVIVFILLSLTVKILVNFGYVAINEKYPREFRDYTNVELVRMISDGKNPYVYSNDPMYQFVNVYTPLNEIVCSVLYLLTNVSIITLLYVLDYVYIVLICIISSIYVYKKTNHNLLLSALCAFLFISTSYRLGYIGTVPDRLGVLISCLLYISVDCYKNRKYSWIWFSILSVCLFYIKQYFVISAFPIFLILLFNNKNNAIKYILSCIIIGLGSLYLINMFCPLFTIYTLYFFCVESTTESVNGLDNIDYSIDQLLVIWNLFKGIILGSFIVIMGCKIKKIQKSKENLNIWLFVIIVMIPVLFILGKNKGAYLSYHLQLLVPALIIYCCIAISTLNRNNIFSLLLYSSIVIIEVVNLYPFYNIKVLSVNEVSEWINLYTLLDEETSKGRVLVDAPQLGLYCLENELQDYNNGHSGYIDFLQYTDDENNILVAIMRSMGLIDNLEQLKNYSLNRSEALTEAIVEKEYDYLVLHGGYSDVIYYAEESGYILIDSYDLNMGTQEMNVKVYCDREIN